MPADDLDAMSLDELRKLKEEVLSRIEEIGSHSDDVDPEKAEEIKMLDDLLREIEERLGGAA